MAFADLNATQKSSSAAAEVMVSYCTLGVSLVDFHVGLRGCRAAS
jgi:hypothetical protein